ncbi:sigma-70 family RNA polymerase sigma factor [Amycolatopsis sp. OK19-0408]|uniref:Sigma-70 family RNA polymerase sigma factor n=1 Tax=Amycolatopsis iheyensis TaxID=2945988 RepID=A0A9X2NFB9_9PSEU|nr:sigma-70 family RNA polymerase sigma factor [Amycolatopsis iheyensis]MCR6485674.1 sigma-70 family RNA polymerase sigma factor [Amycolatopsis iheyensis]
MTTAVEAPERLLAAARPLVVRYCRTRLDPELADDVAQEVCIAVLRALPRRPPERSFPAFVCGIARQYVVLAHKAAAKVQDEPVAELPDEADPAMDPEHHALQRELGERVGRLLQVLSEKQREIVLLRVVVGLSADETAEVVGSTAGAVRVAQHRALGQLRKAVAG